MLSKMQKSAFVIAAVIVAAFIWGPHPALAAQDGAGFWTYFTDRYIALVNLTDYPLTYVRSNEPGAFPYPDCWNAISGICPQPVFEAGTDWEIDPFRTKVWYSTGEGYTAHDGRMTLYSEGFPEWKFDVVFKGQHASGLLYSGTWTALSPGYHGVFAQVSAAEEYSCAVSSETKNNAVFCWGDNAGGRATPPDGSFTQVSTGYWHACGVKTDGHVVCWGEQR